ncbi:helix-turn-helix domain-containing protein [Paenibacillus sp. CMAA1364]
MGRSKILNLDQLPDILTPQHVADYVGISRQRIYEFCQCKEIKSFTIGASRKIHKADMLIWLNRIGVQANE